jgi:hypothetical protein
MVSKVISLVLTLLFQFFIIDNSYANKISNVKTIVENGPVTVFPIYSGSSDGQVLAMAYLEERRGLNVAVSANSGENWTFLKDLTRETNVFDFSIDVSANGQEVIVVWIQRAPSSKIYFRKSTDRGNTWSDTQIVPTPNVSTQMTQINLSQSYDGKTKLITYFAQVSSQSQFMTFYQNSTFDYGTSWLFSKSDASDIVQPYSDSRVSTDGKYLAYSYESYGNKDTQGKLRFSISNDGINWDLERVIDTGNTFSPESEILRLNESEVIILYESSNTILISNNLGKTFRKILIPRSGFARNTWVSPDTKRIFSVTKDSSSKGRVVYLITSMDSGITWSKPSILIDGADNQSTLSVVGDGRFLSLLISSWGQKDLWLIMSSDYGQTWTPPFKVNKDSELARVTAAGQKMGLFVNSIKSEFAILNNSMTLGTNIYTQQLIKFPYFKVEFDGNLNTGGSAPNSLISLNGSEVLIPAKSNDFVRQHYKFLGWSKTGDSSNSLFLPGQSIKEITSDIKVQAVWQELQNFTVLFDSNNILKNSAVPVKIWSDSDTRILEVKPSEVLDKKIFTVWNTRPDGSGLSINVGQSIYTFYSSNNLSGDLKLFAIGKSVMSAPSKQNVISIRCSKGNQVKKITGVSPKCPVGYKRI